MKKKNSYRYEEKGGEVQNNHRVGKAFLRVTRNPETITKKTPQTIVVFHLAKQAPGQFKSPNNTLEGGGWGGGGVSGTPSRD